MKCGEQIKFLAFANDVEFLDQENYISVVALIEGWEEMLEIEINDTDLTRFLTVVFSEFEKEVYDFNFKYDASTVISAFLNYRSFRNIDFSKTRENSEFKKLNDKFATEIEDEHLKYEAKKLTKKDNITYEELFEIFAERLIKRTEKANKKQRRIFCNLITTNEKTAI